MALVTVKPTRIDVAIADEIAAQTDYEVEDASKALTWGADEHVLLALAAAGWLYVQVRKPQQAPLANHILTVSLVTAVLPHILKSAFDQTRPDRLTIVGHRHGVPVSGRARDAFPSGHAVHMGALASAAGLLPPARRRTVRAIAVALSLTRIALLAHWASDVVAGFALGASVERFLRPWTLAGRRRDSRRPRIERA
ncbi:phosphatase PAP2 family protein [Bradyrhizobium liaoningense]|uniref:phosphatase PAP2 family protein n=1 Tax=Bradyrhizobium liaoningense TaxID=43992 RepID=UPI001BAA1253|nr:phosphatase PAP2 family protein [Bradyrhizobium liaoningense]MBR0822999.1 phosphatase PAP2 family protein [Bradyrhizobium liaoningense]